MRILLWFLHVALITLLQSTAMVAAKSANSELSKTSESRASMDQARANSTMDPPQPHLRGNDNVGGFQDSSTEEDRGFFDQAAKFTEKLIGTTRMDSLRQKMEIPSFKLARALGKTPKQFEDKLMKNLAKKGITDPVKIERSKALAQEYGLYFVRNMGAGKL
ncbi:hypothetical protein PHYSODRAFT_353350 [Phytophthora sojae]|uniref:RxLR effector protein n=1 Tax=Phytophthora sojae (strain P6497) TaxID=1094619 RepID=G4YEE0_PHYSP|nr:hypothetical protein PHYSODRAFT_353350 [Phytophthora sojae]EGZ26847.1 hypothetical protein PHYSODRAFT_353350 [Phytophthora sojae]|eukprot:XP_009514122.1 hypothetical protein PHYSODRAFT_353350 [Phytophthora sojae]